MNSIGERVREARMNRDPQWTLEDLSQALAEGSGLELGAGTISRIETGARSVYDYEVAAFAQALGMSADVLLGLKEQGR